jgi:hypothetical protein
MIQETGVAMSIFEPYPLQASRAPRLSLFKRKTWAYKFADNSSPLSEIPCANASHLSFRCLSDRFGHFIARLDVIELRLQEQAFGVQFVRRRGVGL